VTKDSAVEPLSTDVLVVGGGPAGTWAEIKGAEAGVDVVLADKGYTGASGATASVGTGVWYVDDVPELREAAMASRDALGDHGWMTRVLDETHSRMDELADIQRYPFPVDAAGRSIRDDLQGPEYMRRQRMRVQRLGVRILDHTHRPWNSWSTTTAWCPERWRWTVRRTDRAYRGRSGRACRRWVCVSVQDARM
jgi:succinate dehydrogenase/fumarate reductase flavoprotein subunit